MASGKDRADSKKREGSCVSLWLDNDQVKKLAELAKSSGKSRSDVIRAMIDRKRLPDVSFWQTYQMLAQLGAHLKKTGDQATGAEILAIARRLEASTLA